MPTPMSMLMPGCRCKYFQMVYCKYCIEKNDLNIHLYSRRWLNYLFFCFDLSKYLFGGKRKLRKNDHHKKRKGSHEIEGIIRNFPFLCLMWVKSF